MKQRRVMRLPPGFRFHPTDEELVEQYLKRKVFCCPLPAFVIPEVELSRYDPWDLPGGATGEKERYLFNSKEGKYRQGSRSSRAAASGYWKATGKEKVILASKGGYVAGMKKVLVFYRGKPPHGSRTDWVMHEYRLGGFAGTVAAGGLSLQLDSSTSHSLKLQMENWVLCRIFQKRRAPGRGEEPSVDLMSQEVGEVERDPELSCVTEENTDGSNSEDEGCSSSRFLHPNSRGM